MDRAVEMVRQRVALVSGMAAAPEAGGKRDQGRQVAPLTRRECPMRGRVLERRCPQRHGSPRSLPLLLPRYRGASCQQL
jgi:hypothetical protein